MADVERERHVVVERSSTGAWVVVAVVVILALVVLLFLWPGWLVGTADDDTDVINIEETNGTEEETDIDVTTPEDSEEGGSEETTP